MSKLLKIVTVAMTSFMLTLSASFASTVDPTASMIFDGNDNAAGQAELNIWLNSLGVYEPGATGFQLDKVDAPLGSSGDLSVTYDGLATDSVTGSWDWGGLDAISLVVYKAGNNFVAHWFEDGLFSNMWDTGALGLVNGRGGAQGISHISVYGVDGTLLNPTVVPLPAAGWLLLVGFGGLAGLKRRKKA